jgi:hypothetical protein
MPDDPKPPARELKPGEKCETCGTVRAAEKKAEPLTRVAFTGKQMTKGSTIRIGDRTYEHEEVADLPASEARNANESGYTVTVAPNTRLGKPEPPEPETRGRGRRGGVNASTLGADPPARG